MLSWYTSWFRTSDTLNLYAYAKHVAAAFAFFLGFAILGAGLFELVARLFIALDRHSWVIWPVISGVIWLIYVATGLLAIGSLIGILVASTIRFSRYLLAHR